MYYFIFGGLKGIPCDVHVINWARELHWTPDFDGKLSGEFVRISLQTWVPFYQWKNVNPALASLAQLMKIKKNSPKIEEVASRPQHLFVKEKIMHMLRFYQKKKTDSEES